MTFINISNKNYTENQKLYSVRVQKKIEISIKHSTGRL